MSSQFKTVGIFGRVRNPRIKETLISLITYLDSINQNFLVDSETAGVLDDYSGKCVAKRDLSNMCDLIIVVGGDGSLLQAVHTVINDETPVLGINRGRLGFLTDILPSELQKIKDILEGQFIIEKRFLLTATVYAGSVKLGESDGLNEVALIPDLIPHMNQFEIYIDDKFVFSQESDGLIVATPTGSTAYALSGGGPILHPQLDAMVLVPMFPHTLSNRPIVVEGDKRITIIISPENTATPRVTCDGQAFINTPPGSYIHIFKKQQRLNLIHPIDYDYYATLRSKLHWGRKLNYTE